MSLTNPSKLIDVQELAYFKAKLQAEMPSATVASDALCVAAAAEIVFTPASSD